MGCDYNAQTLPSSDIDRLIAQFQTPGAAVMKREQDISSGQNKELEEVSLLKLYSDPDPWTPLRFFTPGQLFPPLSNYGYESKTFSGSEHRFIILQQDACLRVSHVDQSNDLHCSVTTAPDSMSSGPLSLMVTGLATSP